MGNAKSNVSDGVKKQADGGSRPIYKLLDLKGGGSLIELTKQASTTKNYAALDEAIKTKVEPFLYNNGEGKLFHISAIVLMRNRDRPKHKHLFKNEAEFDNYREPTDCKDPSMYKLVCWKLDERGAVGESGLHICYLNSGPVHCELAKRMLQFYPNLIYDVYMSDEYYGESVLHMAIVNEDPAMVKFLLDNGAKVNERCIGSFMGPEDQKATRGDSLEHEECVLDQNTNYEGYVYWGEYPHCFAASLGQEECYRLILAKGADPNAQDTNRNTVLHIMVIHEKLEMFNMAYELGAELGLKNNLNLTPLTLAAKLARKDLFFHIMNIEREIYWQIGSVTCAAYPLTQLDTIDTATGGIQKESALNLIVFGETTMHLELMEGPVIDLLHAKWNTFVKARFYKQFILFFIYFLIGSIVFITRPIHKQGKLSTPPSAINLTSLSNSSVTNINATLLPALPFQNLTALLSSYGNFSDMFPLETPENVNSTETTEHDNSDSLLNGVQNKSSGNGSSPRLGKHLSKGMKGIGSDFNIWNKCIPRPVRNIDWIRMGCEISMVMGAISYLLGALRELNFLGYSMFFENLATAPSRVMFLFSCVLIQIMAVLRALCFHETEDNTAIVVMLTTAPYFLFFCRGFKTVGPFVVMIYRMLAGDLLRFVAIYLIFVMGFSQSYYIIFLSYKPHMCADVENPLGTPAESIVAMFMVSLTSFDWMFNSLHCTDHEFMGKFLFVVYMAIVGILLINMLIAMMGNTYTKIAETKNEWQRQWARIVLVVERGVSPKERHDRQGLYSQPMADSTRALVLRLNQSEDEKEEMKELMEIRRYHDKAILRRLNKLRAAEAAANPSPSQHINPPVAPPQK